MTTTTTTSASTGTATVSEARRYQQLRGHLSYLKLNDAADALPRVLDTARTDRLSVTAALERLLEIEVEATEARRQSSRMRFSCLPEPWTMADFDFAAQPGVDEKLIRDLASLRFLDDAANVLFVGPPGVGKTMLAIALARSVVDAGHRVYFTTAAELAARCHKAAIEGRWSTCMRFFAGPKLLVIDELGYLPLPADGAAALFQVINQRYLKSSTILTTNVGIADWAGAFGDATVAAAMLGPGSYTEPRSSESTAPPTGFAPTNDTPTPSALPPASVPPTQNESTMDETPPTRRCATCLTPLPATNPRQRFCSPPCKAEGWRRDHRHDTGRTPTPRKIPATPPPPTIRDCPHCGEPVAVVTLLATPHVARPDTPQHTR